MCFILSSLGLLHLALTFKSPMPDQAEGGCTEKTLNVHEQEEVGKRQNGKSVGMTVSDCTKLSCKTLSTD